MARLGGLLGVLALALLWAGCSEAAVPVGLGVQGKEEELEQWQALYSSAQFSAVRPQVNLFLLSFDKPLASTAPEGVHHLFASNTTWSSGRNTLGRAIYEAEKKQGGLMRYWMFADADMSAVSCKAAAGMPEGTDASALCLQRHLQHYLLGKLQYAQVFFLGALGSEQEHYSFDCGDAQMHAIHRAAVQVLLPYVERLEDLSWQESQAVLWRVAAGCLAGGGVGGGILSLKAENKKHSQYPGGSYLTARAHVISHLYGRKHSLSPHPIDNSTFNTVQGDCSHQPNQLAELQTRATEAPNLGLGHRSSGPHHRHSLRRRRLTDASASASGSGSGSNGLASVVASADISTVAEAQRSGEWRQTTVFRHCHHRLAARFDQYMLGVSLDALDGPRVVPGPEWPKAQV